MKSVIGVNNPYGLIQKAGKKRTNRRKQRTLRKKTRRYRK
jgi:hypothetical protein